MNLKEFIRRELKPKTKQKLVMESLLSGTLWTQQLNSMVLQLASEATTYMYYFFVHVSRQTGLNDYATVVHDNVGTCCLT